MNINLRAPPTLSFLLEDSKAEKPVDSTVTSVFKGRGRVSKNPTEISGSSLDISMIFG